MTEPASPESAVRAAVPAAPKEPALWPDVVLAALVLIFAFLAASFPAGNSDLWMHLAAGRLLAEGEYVFGADPFSYTTEGVYWANHSWLYDIGLHGGYAALGGSAPVVLKASAAALLAGLMLFLARPRPGPKGSFWAGGSCVLLAVLTMSPRLLLQPGCLSLLLLGGCLSLLVAGGRGLYLLPALIALWVNLDSWFLLGPLVVGLFWVGQRLAPASAGGPRLPVWLLPACLAACLLSPHHVFALTLPAELSPAVWLSEFRNNPRFAPLFASPWRLGPLGPAGGYSLAAWAFFVLIALSLISFAFNRSALRSWRFPVWLVFALLAVWQVRLIGFFAVVAGPITALNFRSLGGGECKRVRRFAFVNPCFLVCLASLGLSALTWPGWLQGFHRRDRPLSWTIRPDPSLQRVAESLARWREQGLLPPQGRTLALHPDVAHYCAWFAPGEKGFVDSRAQLFVRIASDYQKICLALSPEGNAAGRPRGTGDGFAALLSDRAVGTVVLYDPDMRRLGPALRTVTLSPERWELLRIEGQAIVVGWKESPAGSPLLTPFDPRRLAFAAEHDESLPPAPETGPAELAAPVPWWDRFLTHSTGSSWEADAARIYLRLFEENTARDLLRQRIAVLARSAVGVAGISAQPGGNLSTASLCASRLVLDQVFLADMHERPAELPLLAVRAARHAVAGHPDDAGAWLVLAQAYLFLDRTTIEASPATVLSPLAELRHIQAVTALVQAVTLKPDLGAAHEMLAKLFAERQYFDLALRHRGIQVRLARQAGPLPGEGPDAFAGRIELLEQAVEQMREPVQTNENRFAVRAQSLAADPLARARLALDLGLAGKARDEVLLRSQADLYGIDGLKLLLELLLKTGEAQAARSLLDRDELVRNPDALGFIDLPGSSRDGSPWGYRFPACDWFDVCQAAASGNYGRASQALERLRDRLKREGDPLIGQLGPVLASRVTAEIGLGTAPEPAIPRLLAHLQRNEMMGMVVQSQFVPVERADLHAVEGMLQLERGDPQAALHQFRIALPLYGLAANTALPLPGRPLSLHYLQQFRNPKSATSKGAS